MSKKSAPPPVVLLWGEDPFLLRDRALQIFGDLRPAEVDGSQWEGGETGDLSTPSLFGEPRGLMVTDAKSIPAAGMKELKAYCASPSPDALLILLAKVAERAKTPPAALAKLLEPDAIVQVEVKRKDLPAWVTSRATARDVQLNGPAAQALIAAVGEETAELDQAIMQLADAFPEGQITPQVIATQFRGLGEQQVWDLCDRAFTHDLAGAIHALRSLLLAREEPIKILGGVSLRVRELLKVRTLPDHAAPQEVARVAGLRFDWQARRYQEQARRFTMAELVSIHGALVEADRVLKLGADGSVVLSSLVTKIAS